MRTTTNYRECWQRVLMAIVALMCLVILSGCWVTSVNGLEEGGLFTHRDRDLTFEQSLIGTWRSTIEKCTLQLSVSAEVQTYVIKATQEGEGCGDSRKDSFSNARLFKLDGHLFLDSFPRPNDVCSACLPLHEIYLTSADKDSWSLTPIDSDWLKHALEKKTVALATMPDNSDLLTASPKDLKAFCRKYADDSEVFKPIGLVFKRK